MKAWEAPLFAELINNAAKEIYQWAQAKGFWKVPPSVDQLIATDPEASKFIGDLIRVRKMALVTTETSEAVEAIRKDTGSSVPGFDNDTEEQADQIIRILDYCGARGMDIGGCIAAKMAVNEGRPFQHGKKF